MNRELNLEDGVQASIKSIEKVTDRPIWVAVYGWPNSGKSYFIGEVGAYFEKKGLTVGKAGGATGPQFFERFRNGDKYFKDLTLFHCGWQRNNTNESWMRAMVNEDPNLLAENIANRKINLNIGIYNPNSTNTPLGEYDLIISNPNSVDKYKRYIPNRS